MFFYVTFGFFLKKVFHSRFSKSIKNESNSIFSLCWGMRFLGWWWTTNKQNKLIWHFNFFLLISFRTHRENCFFCLKQVRVSNWNTRSFRPNFPFWFPSDKKKHVQNTFSPKKVCLSPLSENYMFFPTCTKDCWQAMWPPHVPYRGGGFYLPKWLWFPTVSFSQSDWLVSRPSVRLWDKRSKYQKWYSGIPLEGKFVSFLLVFPQENFERKEKADSRIAFERIYPHPPL